MAIDGLRFDPSLYPRSKTIHPQEVREAKVQLHAMTHNDLADGLHALKRHKFTIALHTALFRLSKRIYAAVAFRVAKSDVVRIGQWHAIVAPLRDIDVEKDVEKNDVPPKKPTRSKLEPRSPSTEITSTKVSPKASREEAIMAQIRADFSDEPFFVWAMEHMFVTSQIPNSPKMVSWNAVKKGDGTTDVTIELERGAILDSHATIQQIDNLPGNLNDHRELIETLLEGSTMVIAKTIRANWNPNTRFLAFNPEDKPFRPMSDGKEMGHSVGLQFKTEGGCDSFTTEKVRYWGAIFRVCGKIFSNAFLLAKHRSAIKEVANADHEWDRKAIEDYWAKGVWHAT